LPHQAVSSVEKSIELIKTLMPGRIAFYSYAHVPWKSKVQRRYTDSDLPNAAEKWEMYNTGRSLLEEAGFESIGMDHFALKDDALFVAASNNKLHRNFMGYTTTKSKLIIGLGVSSISDSWNAFAQNEKEVELYEEKINKGILPLVNGHLLNEEDLVIRKNILELMCNDRTLIDNKLLDDDFIESAFSKLLEFEKDGLVRVNGYKIDVTSKGKCFIRNISAAIDTRLWRNHIERETFSKAI
jgi:oxygen-independent coproporphyrinogen-3 oxidase